MSLIDGIGDEVTQFLIAVLLVVVVAIAWWSTNTTRDPRSVRGVYLLDYRVRMLRDYQRTYQSNRVASLPYNRQNNRHPSVRVISNNRSTSTGSIQLEDPIATSATTTAVIGETSNAPAFSAIPRIRERTTARESIPPVDPVAIDTTDTESNEAEVLAEQERATIIQVMDADETEVRRRRIAFFTGRRDEGNQQETTSDVAVASSSIQSERPESIMNTTTATIGPAESDASDSEEEEESAIGDGNIYEGDYDRELDSTIMEHNYAELPMIDNRTITIKLKYTNDDMRIVTGKLQEKLGDFKLRHFADEYSNNRSVRLIFNGKILNEDEQTIASCGIFHNCVVHCLVIQGRRDERPRGTPAGEPVSGSRAAVITDVARQTQFVRTQQQNAADRNGRQRQQREWNLGTLLSRCTNFLLLCAWYLRYSVPHIWTMTATLCLVALTGFSIIAHVGVYMPNGQTTHNVNIRATRVDTDMAN